MYLIEIFVIGKTYLEKNGVSMGSLLGLTFADFYMFSVENYLLPQNKISNPILYIRYVDDILALFANKNHVHHFIRRLKNNSVLNFTSDLMTDNCFHFLDVKLYVRDGQISTSVFIKDTDKGLYCSYLSHMLPQYKRSIIKTLVHRALKLCSSWKEVDVEMGRLKQVFVNNNIPYQ